jgi:hypothetical protein
MPAIELLDEASLWITTRVTKDDIEFERQAMEAKHREKLAVHSVEHPTHSGVLCTRVTWEVTS